MKLNEFYNRMSSRERLLAMGVAGVVFVLFNFLAWSWLIGAIRQGREDIEKRHAARKEQDVFIKERDVWTKRDEWLQQHQPVITNPAEASTLLTQFQKAAEKRNVLVENPQLGSGETTPNHRAVWASVDTKSAWKPLIEFLYDIQQPEAFVVFESANLSVDSNDPTSLRGKFKIARWFAPAQRSRSQP
jgi:hypothetical protein